DISLMVLNDLLHARRRKRRGLVFRGEVGEGKLLGRGPEHDERTDREQADPGGHSGSVSFRGPGYGTRDPGPEQCRPGDKARIPRTRPRTPPLILRTITSNATLPQLARPRKKNGHVDLDE